MTCLKLILGSFKNHTSIGHISESIEIQHLKFWPYVLNNIYYVSSKFHGMKCTKKIVIVKVSNWDVCSLVHDYIEILNSIGHILKSVVKYRMNFWKNASAYITSISSNFHLIKSPKTSYHGKVKLTWNQFTTLLF